MQAPNILFVMADQFRHDYLACAGAAPVRTPCLDELAAAGMRFRQCMTNAPVCAPARIGLASGLQPWRLGSLDNNSYLPRGVTTYYQRLRDAGYRVGCVGKLDLAKPDPHNGRDGDRPRVFGWGFTHPVECEGKMHAGAYDTPQGPYGNWLESRGLYRKFREDYARRAAAGWIRDACHDSVLPLEAYEDVYIGRRACEWVRDIPDDAPWHLFVSFVGPHDPFDPPREYADLYRRADMPEALPAVWDGKPDWVRQRRLPLAPEAVQETRRQYCAEIELIDDQVGALLGALRKRGFEQNTIVLFASDHGEQLGDLGLYAKSFAYEGALRVPLLIAGPGILQDTVSDTLVELNDLHPTLCELAGLRAPEGLDSQSLLPVLTGDSCAHRQETVSVLRNFTCIRTHTHKLIHNVNGPEELYDLDNDPGETFNLAAESGDIATDLRLRLRARLKDEPRRAERA